HDVDQLALAVVPGVDQLARPRRPQDLLRPRAVGVPGDGDRDGRQHEAEPGNGVVVLVGGRVAGGEGEDVVAAEAQPREKENEANHQPGGAPASAFLLLKEVTGRRGQPSVPPARPRPRSPTAQTVAPWPAPRPGWWETAAAWCCIASRCRCTAGARTRCGSPSSSAPPAAGRCCPSPCVADPAPRR